MAKFWEVIKAFQEGSAVKAFRNSDISVKAIKEEQGIVFYDRNNEPYSAQDISNYDLSMEWQIIEPLDRKEFRVLQIVFQSHMEGRTPRLIPEAIENDSLDNAIGRIRNDYTDETLTVLSAVGITEEGETIILVQEGDIVE